MRTRVETADLSAGPVRNFLRCRVGRSWRFSPAAEGRRVCLDCGTAVLQPAGFCSGCGARLTHDMPASPSDVRGRLTPQQASLVRAVVSRRPDYLRQSFRRDPDTGQRVAHALGQREWSDFVANWKAEPLACIRTINQAIAHLETPGRVTRYLEAAVELETLMDRRACGGAPERVETGIPGYIMDGYTDMGRNPSPSLRHGREKIRVDKAQLKPWLVESRWRALAYEPEELLVGFHDAVRQRVSFDEARVKDLACDADAASVSLSRFLDDGVGICRHLSLLYQLCLQEAAIPARVVKGAVRVFGLHGRHAWNLAWIGSRVALVDVTLPDPGGPLIVIGDSEAEVYRTANQGVRQYWPTPDAQNHYKIGALIH